MMVIFIYGNCPFLCFFLMKYSFGAFAFVKIWVIYLFIIEFYIYWVVFMYSCMCVCVCIRSIICKNFFSVCGILYFYLLNCISQLCTKGHQLYITQKALEAVFPNRGAVLTLRDILSSSQACWLQLLFVLVWGRELFCTSEDI